MPKYKDLSPEEFEQKMQGDNAVVIDVRTPAELAEGEVPGHRMINIAEPQKFMEEVEELDKEKEYLVYCRSGGRSAQACNYMGSKGFEKCYNLLGGIKAWNEYQDKK